MAITPAACQAALSDNPMGARIIHAVEVTVGDSNQRWYAIGGVDAPGRACWTVTAAAGNAATQAAAILAALRA
jgi:hypothetical protein